MSYPGEIKTAARLAIAKRRERAEQKTLQNRAAVFAALPDAEALEREIASASARVAKTILSGEDVAGRISEIREMNLRGQEKLSSLLRANGFSLDALRDVHYCPLCRDTGVAADGSVCSCVKEMEKSLMLEKLGAGANNAGRDFASFDLSLYGERERPIMKKTFELCRRYAQEFSPASENLLMIGGPGLGKTHLSLAIAFTVAENGGYVCYMPFHRLYSRLEDARFGRSEEDFPRMMSEPLSCELLILDDLGSELPSSFAAAVLYEIVNTRLTEGRPTIISTNLTDREIIDRYKERVYSRLFGAYRKLPFVGEDIRLKKPNHINKG